MSEDRTEAPRNEDFPEYIFVVNNNEYDEEFIFYNSLKQLGYKVALLPGGIDDVGTPLDEEELRVMADNEETRIRIDQLRTKFGDIPVSLTLALIKQAPREILGYIRTGELSVARSADPDNPIKLVDNPQVLNSAFMRAYEMSQEFRQVPHGVDEADRYYAGLKAEGVEPIKVEEMGALVISGIRQILVQNPELKPPQQP